MKQFFQKAFDVPKLGRLQLGLSSGYDPEIVATAMGHFPIRIEVVGFTEGLCRLLVSYPKGINVNLLAGEETHQGYFADLEDGVYTKLFVGRKPGKGVALTFNQSTLTEDLLLTRKFPIVIEPTQNHLRSKVPFALLVGAYRTIAIERLESFAINVAHDPFSIPENMLALLSILDESSPHDEKHRKTFNLRLLNIRGLFEWYARKTLALDIQEELQTIVARLNDAIIRSDNHAGTNDNETATQIEEASFLAKFEQEEAFEFIAAALKEEEFEGIPIHECGRCGAGAEIQTRRATNSIDGRWLSLVKCTSCNNQLARNDWGIECQAVGVWNKQNGHYDVDLYPEGIEIEGLSEQEFHRRLKLINSFVAKVSEAMTKLNDVEKDALVDLKERLLEIQMWMQYLRTAAKKKKHQNSRRAI